MIRRYDVGVLESAVTNDDEQFELDYQITHLVHHEARILDESDDLDLVAELAYCYLVLNTRKKWVRKAIDRILVTQNPNGAWGTKEELHLGMYDRMHGTWTAVTALCHSLSRQAP